MSPLSPIEQLPLVLDGGTVCYRAESGASWPLFAVSTDGSSVSDERVARVLEAMLAAYNAQLSAPHNHDACDPDGHVLFDSVCCGAQLYRCSALADGLPSKPIIAHGESHCRSCGADLAQF